MEWQKSMRREVSRSPDPSEYQSCDHLGLAKAADVQDQ